MKTNQPAILDTLQAINGHVQISGITGMGKSYRLQYLAKALVESAATLRTPLRIHVFDPHGDLEMPYSSDVKFSSATNYGVGPLMFLMAMLWRKGKRGKIWFWICAIAITGLAALSFSGEPAIGTGSFDENLVLFLGTLGMLLYMVLATAGVIYSIRQGLAKKRANSQLNRDASGARY